MHIEYFKLKEFERWWYRKVKVLVSQLCLTLYDPMDCSPPVSSVHGILQTRVGCHFLLQGIFLTQGLNLGLLHCRQFLYHLSHSRWYGKDSPTSTFSSHLRGFHVPREDRSIFIFKDGRMLRGIRMNGPC